jgi:hypothetical protein
LFLNFHKKEIEFGLDFSFLVGFGFFFFGFFFKLLDSLKRVLWCFFLCGFLDKNNLKNKFFYLNSRQQRTYRLFIFFCQKKIVHTSPPEKEKKYPWHVSFRCEAPAPRFFSLFFY